MSCLVLFFAKTLSFWALSGRGRWSRNRQERGRAAPADASFPRAGHVTRAREEGGRCLALSLARGWGGTRGLLPRTSSGPGGGWQKRPPSKDEQRAGGGGGWQKRPPSKDEKQARGRVAEATSFQG